MMQTGPVVTLRVAKFGASYHGLASLLSQQNSGKYRIRRNTCSQDFFVCHFLFFVSPTLLGTESPTCPNSVEYTVANVDSGISDYPCRLSKRKKEQLMLRNRQLYRSNPNMISKYHCLMMLGTQNENPSTCLRFLLKPADFDNGNNAAVPGTIWTNMAAVSSGNLCGDVSVVFCNNQFI